MFMTTPTKFHKSWSVILCYIITLCSSRHFISRVPMVHKLDILTKMWI